MQKIYRHIGISTQKIDAGDMWSFVQHPDCGAICHFLGVVRQYNLGKKVLKISYDVHPSMAEKVFLEIDQEIRDQWGEDLHLYLVHYHGELDIGEIATAIAVSTPHRDEAFQACRYVIEQIKHRAPIWKKEYYLDGATEWVKGCELCK